jgi:hypothetical protein
MKPGDRVKVVGIPPGLRDDDDLMTRTLFEKCLGQIFTVIGVDPVEGLPYPLVELHVTISGDHAMDGGGESYDTIWIEPEYLRLELAT